MGLNTQKRVDSQGLGFAIPGRQVLEYWQEFNKLYGAGKLSVPSDEEIARMEQTLSLREILESAAQLAGLCLEKRDIENGDMWAVKTPNGDFFGVFFDDKRFTLLRNIGGLNEDHLDDPQFLLQLLRWHDDMDMVRFLIADEDVLWFEYGRSSEDLDVSEVCKAFLAMADVVDSYMPQLKKHLEAR